MNPAMPMRAVIEARTASADPSGRNIAYHASAPNPNASTSEATSNAGRFHIASRRGPQKQMAFTGLQQLHGTVFNPLST